MPSEAEKQALIELARDDFTTFCELINPRWQPARHLLHLIPYLQAVERHEIIRLIVTMPPQHGKSWTTSQHFPAWYWGRHPDHYIIESAYNEDKVKDFALSVDDQIHNELYGLIFPDLKIRQDADTQLMKVSLRGGMYLAVGRGGGATGRPADVFIIDDPYKDREEASSDAVRREIRSWWDDVIYTRLAPRGAVIVIHTRWAEDDMIGWLIAQHPQENWTIVNLPAIAEEDDPLGRSEGEPLWPQRYSLEELEKRRRNNPLTFQALYQQRPVGTGALMFRREWMEASYMNSRYHPSKPQYFRGMNLLLLVDPANSKSKSADYTSMWVLGMASDRNFYVLDMIRDRLSLTERANTVFRLHKRWGFNRVMSRVGYEQYGMQADIPHLNDKMARENYRFVVLELAGRLSKPDRIARLVGLFENGRIIMPLYLHRTDCDGVEQDLMQVFIEEEYGKYLTGGGGTDHDDMLDSLSRLFDIPDLEGMWPRSEEERMHSLDNVRQLRDARAARRGRTWMSA